MAAASSSSSSSSDGRRRVGLGGSDPLPPLPRTFASASASSGGSGGGGLDCSSVLLSAAQSDADRRDRELMNLKMEISHLRERLLMRVGGDTTAAELEAENFALKTSLMDAQEAHSASRGSLQRLDAKYAKALSNLVKMDHAWKQSIADAKRARADVTERDATIVLMKEESAKKAKTYQDDCDKRQTLVSYQEAKINELERVTKKKESELSTQLDTIQRLTLSVKEVESELETVKRRSQESSAQQTVPKEEYDALLAQHQSAMETCAALRGEANALRDERGVAHTQLSDTKASLSAAMSKFLQLKEDNATLEVRVAAANEKSSQWERDVAFYKGEVDRIQSELTKRDEELLQLERSSQVLELKLSQQQRLAQDAVVVRDHAAKRLELQQELTWKDRQFELEKEVRTLTHQCEVKQAEVQAMQQQQHELRQLLVAKGELAQHNADADGRSSNNSSAVDLKSLVVDTLTRHAETMYAAQEQHKAMVRLEKELTKMKALADENATLKVEYEKTRKAMERIVGRKTKTMANNSERPSGGASGGGSTPSTMAAATSSSSSSFPFATQSKAAASSLTGSAWTGSSLGGTKRKLVLPAGESRSGSGNGSGSGSFRTSTPPPDSSSSALFSPNKKRVVHVQSRYLQPIKNPKR